MNVSLSSLSRRRVDIIGQHQSILSTFKFSHAPLCRCADNHRLRIRYAHFAPRIARLYIESKGTQITIGQKSPERHLRSAKGHYVISLSILSFIVAVMETDVEVHMQDVKLANNNKDVAVSSWSLLTSVSVEHAVICMHGN